MTEVNKKVLKRHLKCPRALQGRDVPPAVPTPYREAPLLANGAMSTPNVDTVRDGRMRSCQPATLEYCDQNAINMTAGQNKYVLNAHGLEINAHCLYLALPDLKTCIF